MIEFTKFDAITGEILAWHQTTDPDQVGAQLVAGQAATLGRHQTPDTLFSDGQALYRGPDGEIQLIDSLIVARKDLTNDQ